MTASPFATVAPVLIDLGYAPVTIIPPNTQHAGRSKAPGQFRSGCWSGFPGWSKLVDEPLSGFNLRLALAAPDAGCGIVLGTPAGTSDDGRPLQVVGIDYDVDGDELDILLRATKASPMAKAGRKGLTRMFRAPVEIVSKSYDGPNGRILDLLAKGRQTVVPPSLTIDDGKAYRWVGDGPVAARDLPIFDENDLAQLEEALERPVRDALGPAPMSEHEARHHERLTHAHLVGEPAAPHRYSGGRRLLLDLDRHRGGGGGGGGARLLLLLLLLVGLRRLEREHEGEALLLVRPELRPGHQPLRLGLLPRVDLLHLVEGRLGGQRPGGRVRARGSGQRSGRELLHLGEDLVAAPAGHDRPRHVVPSRRGGAARRSARGALPRMLLAPGPPHGAGVRRHAVLRPGLALAHGDVTHEAVAVLARGELRAFHPWVLRAVLARLVREQG